MKKFSPFQLGIFRSLCICLPILFFQASVIFFVVFIPLANEDVGGESFWKLSLKEKYQVTNLFLHRNFYLKMWDHVLPRTMQASEISRIDISIHPHDLQKIHKNLPDTGKKNWYPAKVKKDGIEYEAQVKLRGASYWHWTYPHKSWRLRLSRREKTTGLHELDIVRTKQSLPYIEPLTQELAAKVGLVSPLTSPIELFINGRYSGFSYLLEKTEETFLRRNNLGLGSIFSIERENDSEKAWKNIEHWNVVEGKTLEKDQEYLQELLDIIKSNDEVQFVEFWDQIQSKEQILSYIAFDAIFGVIHHDRSNSVRYFVNSSENKIVPIPWDHVLWTHSEGIHVATNPLANMMFRISKIRKKLYGKIWDIIHNKLDIKTIHRTIEKYHRLSKSAIIASPAKMSVLHPWQRCFLPVYFRHFFHFTEHDLENTMVHYKQMMRNRINFLKNTLGESRLKGKVERGEGFFKLEFQVNTESPIQLVPHKSAEKVVFDSNKNGHWDQSDLVLTDQELAFSGEKRRGGLPEKGFLGSGKSTIHPRTYRFFSAKKASLLKYLKYFKNSITGREIQFDLKATKPVAKTGEADEFPRPSSNKFWIVASHSKKKDETSFWGPGTIYVDKNLFAENTVSISPGTKIFLNKGSLISFRGGLIAKGLKGKPILFQSESGGRIKIEDTSKRSSVLTHTIFKFTQKKFEPPSFYPWSIHIANSQDVVIRDSIFTGSEATDSVVYVKNSKNIVLDGVTSEASLSSFLRSEKSNILLKNLNVRQAGATEIKSYGSKINIISSNFGYNLHPSIDLKEESIALLRDISSHSLHEPQFVYSTDSKIDKALR